MRPLLLNLVPSRLWILLGFMGGMYPVESIADRRTRHFLMPTLQEDGEGK
jgi:hypothetical protein